MASQFYSSVYAKSKHAVRKMTKKEYYTALFFGFREMYLFENRSGPSLKTKFYSRQVRHYANKLDELKFNAK